jgi:hypothetical protein
MRPLIILIHGTWARGFLFRTNPSPDGQRWFEPKSIFFSDVLSDFHSSDIHVFSWSGRNSILARKTASSELWKLIISKIGDGFTDLVLIGHSHGGNVIIDTLPLINDDFNRITIITLATPFIDFTDKVQSAGEASLYLMGYFVLIALLSSPFLQYQLAFVLYFTI